MRFQFINAARAIETASVITVPAARVPAVTVRRAILLGLALLLAIGPPLAAPSAARAGLSDLFSTSEPAKPKKTVKKAGMFQNTKKPTTATGRMFNSLMSGPNKMTASAMSALLPGKKTTPTSKSRTVPRKMVSDQQEPSMLGKLFAPKKQAPQTVTEWMQQPRPKP
jgi:hypothetical protein